MQRYTKFVLACAVFLLVGLVKVAAVEASPKKTSLERMLAGYSIEKSDHVALRDTHTGYYLIRIGHCDGADRHLMLSLDLKAIEGEVEQSAIRPGSLRNLQTGRGIRIGDTLGRVRQIMGRPTWQGSSKYTSGERVWSYHHLNGTHEDGVEYTTLFRFQKGVVTGIELDRQMWPG